MATRTEVKALYRFLEHVHFGTDCWEWMGKRNDNGYGIYNDQRVHRLMYEMMIGPIADGLQIDHLCRNRSCCNPEHLEPVEQAINLQRRDSAKIMCPHGHFLEGVRANGYRYCLTCNRQRRKLWRDERKSN